MIKQSYTVNGKRVTIEPAESYGNAGAVTITVEDNEHNRVDEVTIPKDAIPYVKRALGEASE